MSCRQTSSVKRQALDAKLNQALLTALAAACLLSHPAVGQSGKLSGIVYRDSAGNRLAGAEIVLESLNRKTISNDSGVFRFDGIPIGRTPIAIRRIGFSPLLDTVNVRGADTEERRFILVAEAVRLDSQIVSAPAPRYLSPGLREFEERRRQGFGRFISEEELRKTSQSQLVGAITSRIPGLKRFRVPPDGRGGHGQTYVGTSRQCSRGSAFECTGTQSFCPPTLYVDGILLYSAANNMPNMTNEADIPDLDRLKTADYAGIEFYAGGASVPVKFNATSAGCGVLVLWTRQP